MSGHSIAALRAEAVQAPAVNSEIERIWRELRESGCLDKELSQAGIDPAALGPAALGPAALGTDAAPFVARRGESQLGIAETLLIALATGAATEAGKSAYRALWDRVIWPRLSRRFGAALEPDDARGDR